MSSDEKKVLPRIRTFADDFKRSKGSNKDEKIVNDITLPTKGEFSNNPETNTLKNETEKKIVINPKRINTRDNDYSSFENSGVDLEEIETGSIVRETKRKKFKLFPAISESFKVWLETRKSTKERKLDKVPKVISPEHRKEILTNAAALGVLPESDDHKRISVRLKETEREEHHSNIAVAGKEAEPVAGWGTLNEEEQEIIHDAAISELEEAVEDPEEKTLSEIKTEPQKEELEELPTIERTPEQTQYRHNEPEELSNVIEKDPVELPIEETPNQTQYKYTEPEEIPNLIEEEPKEVFENIPEEPKSYQYRSSKPSPSTNNQIPFILLLVILVAIIVGAFGTITIYRYLTQPDKILAPNINTVINADKNISYSLDGESFFEEIRKQTNQAEGQITQYYPIRVSTEGVILSATMEEQLSLMPFAIPGSFSRSIKEFSFGTGLSKAPFVIIVSNNFDTAFAGMLEWERSIGFDLSPWFGEFPNASFTDITSNNRDIRLAKRSDGSEIMYTFLSRTTILITTNRAVLESVPSRIGQ